MVKFDVDASSGSQPGGGRKIGLALGSGSARGLAHIGVLRAIREAGIEVNLIAGSSMGAVVGAIFASGNLEGLAANLSRFDWRNIAAMLDPIFPRSGLIEGQKIAEFVRAHIPDTRIEDLPIPFRSVAVDITSGEEVVIEIGDLIEAVRASISVPGIFTPVRSNGRILVDGGLINPVPVSVVRSMGADLIIAVDLNHDIVSSRLSRPGSLVESKVSTPAISRLVEGLGSRENAALSQLRAWLNKEPLPGIFEVLLASIYIMQARITQVTLQHDMPDILIQPPLGAVRFMEFDRAEEIIEIGYQCAADQLSAWNKAAGDRA